MGTSDILLGVTLQWTSIDPILGGVAIIVRIQVVDSAVWATYARSETLPTLTYRMLIQKAANSLNTL